MKISHKTGLLITMAVALLTAVASSMGYAETSNGALTGKPTASELVQKGRQHIAVGNWVEAEKVFRRVVTLYPERETSAVALGASLIQLRKYREALDVLGPLLKKYPDRPDLKNNIAWIHLKATDASIRDAKLALQYVREALLIDSNSANIWGTLADVHYEIENYDRALRAARIAVALARNSKTEDAWEYWELLRRCGQAAGTKVTEGLKDEIGGKGSP